MSNKKLFDLTEGMPSDTDKFAFGTASTLAKNITLSELRRAITGTTAPVQLLSVSVNIGPWNMDSTRGKNVTTGIPLSKIRSIADITIKSDSGEMFPFYYPNGNWELSGCVKVCNTPTNNAVINIARNDGYFFDTAGFNDPYINRGYIIVSYVP